MEFPQKRVPIYFVGIKIRGSNIMEHPGMKYVRPLPAKDPTQARLRLPFTISDSTQIDYSKLYLYVRFRGPFWKDSCGIATFGIIL